MIIRTATIDDIPIIIDIARKTWPAAYGEILSGGQIEFMLSKFYAPDSLSADFTKRGHIFLIAASPDPIGFAAIGHNLNDRATKIFKLYVLPNQHGKGIGRELICKISELAVMAGDSKLILNVNRSNPAKFFYERLGFQVTSEEDINIGNGYFMNDYIMELELSNPR